MCYTMHYQYTIVYIIIVTELINLQLGPTNLQITVGEKLMGKGHYFVTGFGETSRNANPLL